ncbi:hypothetical protein Bca4012_102503 [Brassica carinata]
MVRLVFRPIPKSGERFARQYRCGPPPEFPLAARSGIVHHLSGPDRHAHTRTLLRRSRSVGCAPVRDPANQLPYALRVYSPVDSHTCQTPCSVFQGGSNGEPTGRRPSTQMPRRAVAPLDGIYRPIGAAFPNNPTRRQRLRGATGSERGGLSPSLAPLSRELGPGPSLRRFSDYNSSAEGVRFSSWALPGSLAVTKGILLPSDILERIGGRRFVTPRQTCPRPEGLGRNLRSKTRWFTGFCNSHQVSHFATFFIDHEPRYPLPRVVLDFTLQHCFRTNTVSGLAKAGCLVECSLTLFVPGFGDIRKLCVQSSETGRWRRITTESVGTKSAKIPAHREFSGLLATSQAANHLRRRDPNTSRIIQSVGAAGGVYKGQGRSQRADDSRLLGIPR